MARPRTRIPLNVYLNGRLVGRLRRQTSGAIEFQYGPEWLSWEHALPVSLSLPLREDGYRGDAVIAVFDNLLPDSEAIRRRLAERVHAGGSDAYSLLAKVGRDCVGALQFLPDGVEPGPAGGRSARTISPARSVTSAPRRLESMRMRNSGFLSPARRKKPRSCCGRKNGTCRTAPQPLRTLLSLRSAFCPAASISRTALRTNIFA